MEELYKYNHVEWPNFTYQMDKLYTALNEVSTNHGRILGRFQDAGIDIRNEVVLSTMSDEVIASASIEGQILDKEDVRNSIRKSLGFSQTKEKFVSDGNVRVLVDAVTHSEDKLTNQKLFDWHKLYFPNGNPDDPTMPIGTYTDERMEIRSSSGKVIYIAPPVERIRSEVNMFLMWFNGVLESHVFIKAGLAHLWFEIIHPFADGNGRIGRAIIDKVLAKQFDTSLKSIGISAYIAQHKSDYYKQLEYHSKGSMDITDFLLWFMKALNGAIDLANHKLDFLLKRDKFWAKYAPLAMNKRQKKVLEKLLSGDFEGVITVGKWSRMTKTSYDSANRDIKELVDFNILIETTNQVRNKKFKLNF